VHIPDGQRRKLDAKSRKLFFVGYLEGTKGHKFYEPSSRKFIRSRNVIFLEKEFHEFGCKQSASCLDYDDDKDVPVVINVPVVGNDVDQDSERAPADGKVDFVIIAIYVDDMLFFPNNVDMLEREKSAIGKRFHVEDLGELHYVLGMSVKRNRGLRALAISQKTYLQGVLKRFDMENCMSVSTPLEFGKKYEALSEEENPVDMKGYQIAIGCLNYGTLISRCSIKVHGKSWTRRVERS
jgi:hypothetical protein